jgi:hypothetical protein
MPDPSADVPRLRPLALASLALFALSLLGALVLGGGVGQRLGLCSADGCSGPATILDLAVGGLAWLGASLVLVAGLAETAVAGRWVWFAGLLVPGASAIAVLASGSAGLAGPPFWFMAGVLALCPLASALYSLVRPLLGRSG